MVCLCHRQVHSFHNKFLSLCNGSKCHHAAQYIVGISASTDQRFTPAMMACPSHVPVTSHVLFYASGSGCVQVGMPAERNAFLARPWPSTCSAIVMGSAVNGQLIPCCIITLDQVTWCALLHGGRSHVTLRVNPSCLKLESEISCRSCSHRPAAQQQIVFVDPSL
jgi:hypothetical protein